jgi:hypothetical protein
MSIDRESITAAMAVVRGELAGNIHVARHTLTQAGFNPDEVQSAAAHREMQARFGTLPSETVHREGNKLVLPQITKEEARRILAKHGGAPAGREEVVAFIKRAR